jgi:hypothetical protein
MEKVDILYNKIINKEPFCFLKLNDGEIGIMNSSSENFIASRGFQKSSILLSEKMKECLNYEDENYFIGLTCEGCDSKNKNIAYELLINKEKGNILNGNIFINSNVNKTIDILSNHLIDRNIVIVTNENLSKNIDKLKLLNINVSHVIEVSNKDSFDNDYENIKNNW